jgi:protein tyrosine/serine phosphatase
VQRRADVLNRFLTDDTRRARRLARIARFEKPIGGPGDRLRAWANMLLVDHGVFRLAYLNWHAVAPGRLWRSAQPAPHQLAWFRRQGVRTVISLRGGREHGSWQLQREACARQGLELVEFVVRSREAPDRDTILAAKALFEGIGYPAVMHCKSGADRAGFAAALYLVLHEGVPVAEAMRQLSARFGHFRFAKTGILDAFFAAYRAEGEARGLGFLEWVETAYDPDALTRAFRTRAWSDFWVDRVLRRE